MLKFGFIGCGKIAKFHAEVIKALNHAIVGVSARPGSKNIHDFSKRFQVQNLYNDWEVMVKEQKIDALIVVTGWDQTELIIQDIINTGIPCLVEKPVALCSKRLEEIINNTKLFNNNVMVGYNRRFYDNITPIKQAIEEKELISVDLNFPEPLEVLMKIKSPAIVQHILIYQSSHWLDLLMFLMGEFEVAWMKAQISRRGGYVKAYNGILRSLRYDIPLHLQVNFDTPSNTSIVFNFCDSIYKLCPIELLTIYKGMQVIEPSEDNPIRRYIPKIIDSFSVDTTYKPGFLNQIKYFIDTCVMKKEPNTKGCTLSQALRVTRFCEKIRSSQ